MQRPFGLDPVRVRSFTTARPFEWTPRHLCRNKHARTVLSVRYTESRQQTRNSNRLVTDSADRCGRFFMVGLPFVASVTGLLNSPSPRRFRESTMNWQRVPGWSLQIVTDVASSGRIRIVCHTSLTPTLSILNLCTTSHRLSTTEDEVHLYITSDETQHNIIISTRSSIT